MENYLVALDGLCGVGGLKFSRHTRSTQYPVLEFSVQLTGCFGVDVQKDSLDVHPAYICHLCKKTVDRFRYAQANGRKFQTAGGCGASVIAEWRAHPSDVDEPCTPCSLFFDRKSGRPSRKKRPIFSAVARSAQGNTSSAFDGNADLEVESPT